MLARNPISESARYTVGEPFGAFRGCIARLPIRRRRAFLLDGRELAMGVGTLRRSGRPHTQNELRRSVRKIVPLPGGLYAERKRCNRPTCRCAAGGDARHGPYLYRRWLDNGHRRSQYVKAADAERVRAGLAEWRRLHPPARSARDVLAELRGLIRDLEV